MSTDEESHPDLRGDTDRPPDSSHGVADAGHDPFPESITFSNCLSIDESLRMYRVRPLGWSPTFCIHVRQHAKHGLAIGDGTPHARGARPPPLDPPLVCEVVADNNDHNPLLNVLELSVRARLVHEDGPPTLVAASSAGLPLLGDVDQSAFVGQVYPPRDQSFFIFSELSVRPTGTYRMRFDIVDHSLSSFRIIGSIFSRPFIVHDKKTYPGLSPSTDLILAIIERGLKLRLVKDTEPKKSAAKKKQRSSDVDHVSTSHGGGVVVAEGSRSSLSRSRLSPSSPSSPSVPWVSSPVSMQPPLMSPRQDHINNGALTSPPRRRAYTQIASSSPSSSSRPISNTRQQPISMQGSRSALPSPRLPPPDLPIARRRDPDKPIVSPVRMPGSTMEERSLAQRPSLPSIRYILEAAGAGRAPLPLPLPLDRSQGHSSSATSPRQYDGKLFPPPPPPPPDNSRQ